MFCSFPRINSTDNCASAERAEPTRSLFKCPPGEHFLTQPALPCAHQVHILMCRSNINSSGKYKSPNPGGHGVGPNWFMAALIEPFLHQPLFLFFWLPLLSAIHSPEVCSYQRRSTEGHCRYRYKHYQCFTIEHTLRN